MSGNTNFLKIVGTSGSRKGYAGFGIISADNITLRITVNGNIRLTSSFEESGPHNRIYSNFNSGFLGSGYSLLQRLDGSHLLVDNVTVRNSLYASIFEIDTIRASNGYLFISDCAEVALNLNIENTSHTYTITVNNNTFQTNDLVWYKARNSNGILGIKGVILSLATQLDILDDEGEVIKTYYTYQFQSIYGTGLILSGRTIVRVGNTTNVNRQGSIYFAATGNDTPYMDVYDGVSTFSGSSTSSFSSGDKLKVRVGDLSGVTDDTMDPSGYGLYSLNVFLKGSIIANKGKIGNWFILDGNLYTPNTNNTKIFIGVGEYNNTNSSFYVDSTGKFSLKDKLTFDGNTLSIKGKILSYLGKIANWSITLNSLMSNLTLINSLLLYIKFSDQIYIGKKQDKYILLIGNDLNFIKYDGKDLTISSYINAKGGFLGLWEITLTDIVSNNFRLDASQLQLLIGNILGFKTGSGIFMGRDFNSAPDLLDQILVSSGSDYLSISGSTASAYSYSDYKLFIGLDLGNNFLYDGRNILLTGKITTTRGLIGCWNIDETSIYSGSNSFNNLNSIYFGLLGLSLSNKFIVSSLGSLTASSANINGIISSISGSIGGWNINETGISKNNTSIKSITSSYFGLSIGITASTTFTVDPETKSINIKQKNAGDSYRTVLYSEDKIQSVQNITGVVSVLILYIINTTSLDGTYATGIYLLLYTDEIDKKRYKLFGSNLTRSLSILFLTTNTNKLQIRALAQGVPDFLSSNFDVLNITKVSIGIFDSKVLLSESGLLLFNNPANYIRFGYKDGNQIALIKTGLLLVKNLVVYLNLYHHGQTFNVANDLFGTSADRFVINTLFNSVSPYLLLRGQYNSAKITYTDNLTLENAKIDIDKTVFISNHLVLTENSDINANKVISVDGSKLPLSVIPKGALELLHTVQTEEARLLITKNVTGSGIVNAQNGDTIRVSQTHKMYFVVNDNLLSPDGVIPGSLSAFSLYVASTHWDVIIEKPFSWNLKTNGATQSVDFGELVTFTGSNGITVTNSGRTINFHGTTYTSSAPISLTGVTFGLNYNSSNLKLSSNALNTIQDIGTSSNVKFGGVKVNNVNVVTENRSATLSAGNQINISGSSLQTLANNLNWSISHESITTTTASVTSSSHFVSNIAYNNGHITLITKSPFNMSHTHSINDLSYGIGLNINIVTASNSILSISSNNKTITLDANTRTLNFGTGLVAGSYNAKTNVTVSHKAVDAGSFTTSSATNFLLREIKRDSMGHIYLNSYVNIYTLFSGTSPIAYNSSNGAIGLNYNVTNLTLSGSTHLNTIQDIHTESSPLFKLIKLKLVGNHTQSIISVDTYGLFYFNNSAKFDNYIKIQNGSNKGIKQYVDPNNNVIFSLI